MNYRNYRELPLDESIYWERVGSPIISFSLSLSLHTHMRGGERIPPCDNAIIDKPDGVYRFDFACDNYVILQIIQEGVTNEFQ
jgi:hypothetical protein